MQRGFLFRLCTGRVSNRLEVNRPSSSFLRIPTTCPNRPYLRLYLRTLRGFRYEGVHPYCFQHAWQYATKGVAGNVTSAFLPVGITSCRVKQWGSKYMSARYPLGDAPRGSTSVNINWRSLIPLAFASARRLTPRAAET